MSGHKIWVWQNGRLKYSTNGEEEAPREAVEALAAALALADWAP
jgi:hypothetical protein